jgi:hypothetical protein
VSFRIAKGVYYRAGGFRGQPVETTERLHIDTGVPVVTTKHLFFGGYKRNVDTVTDVFLRYGMKRFVVGLTMISMSGAVLLEGDVCKGANNRGQNR